MNLIRDLVEKQKEAAQPSKKNFPYTLWIHRSFLIFILFSIFGTYTLITAKKHEAKALPFGLNNDYLQVAELNQKFASTVPVPLQSIQVSSVSTDKRIVALLTFLNRYKSPFASIAVARAFIVNADAQGFGDKWQLLPAIAGIESAFGRMTPKKGGKESYNAWGWGGPGGWVYFSSWEDAIQKISKGLALGYGVNNLNPERMMETYCPPCAKSGGAWAINVNRFIAEMNGIYKGM